MVAPLVETWAFAPSTTLLRQSIATHFEAPFVVLLEGRDRAMLIDTGTGDVDLRAPVDRLTSKKLLVAHSHTHSDHVGGDSQFEGRPGTSLVAHDIDAVRSALGLAHVDDVGAIDLGGRIIDVVAIPGHEATHVAFYDRATEILFTGDTLYPGRLYVRDWGAFRDSIARLWAFASARKVSHVIGAHIEMDASQVEYAEKALEHPNEHALPLTMAHLKELHETLRALEAPKRHAGRDWVLVPVESD
jgi:glyoxylase-like metal-dependent hydrolase (beta-lactamase superfamily II)